MHPRSLTGGRNSENAPPAWLAPQCTRIAQQCARAPTCHSAAPRLYFLSNDELLQLLAQTRNVQAVQPHMAKCFDGIRRLDFGEEPRSSDIYAMLSGALHGFVALPPVPGSIARALLVRSQLLHACRRPHAAAGEGERVSLGKVVKARGSVEVWLGAVEAAMVATLRRHAKQGAATYGEDPRTEWVLRQPAQLVLAVSQVFWCADVEEALAAGPQGARDALAALYQVRIARVRVVHACYACMHRMLHVPACERRSCCCCCLQANMAQLGELTRLVRIELPLLARRLLGALMTIDVHGRDVVGALLAKGVSSASDFDWQMQLRYYWEEEDLVVRQVGGGCRARRGCRTRRARPHAHAFAASLCGARLGACCCSLTPSANWLHC